MTGPRAALVAVVAAAVAVAVEPAHAASQQTVAVMPFRDLSARSGSVGEAIRETVTTDLKQLAGVRVVERGALDKVIGELDLQSSRANLDPATAAKVGKLLGATLIVAGAYQEAPPDVRLTARFVKVETGEVVGTAKVDGRARDILRLQDRITAELLRSAGLAQHVDKVVRRSKERRELKGLKVLELYGASLLAQNDTDRRSLLRQAVAEDATFGYAVADLAALEKRLDAYQATADAAHDAAAREARAKLAHVTDGTQALTLVMQVITDLDQRRRWHEVVREGRRLERADWPPAPPSVVRPDEIAGFYVVMAEMRLKDDDALLRDGEAFLRRHNTSPYFAGVKGFVEQAIARKKQADEGRAVAAKELAEMRSSLKWDLCNVAWVYSRNHQHREAERLLRACLALGTSGRPRAETLSNLVRLDLSAADFAAARADLEALEREEPARAKQHDASFRSEIPADE